MILARLTHIAGASRFASGDLEFSRHACAYDPGLAKTGGGSWHQDPCWGGVCVCVSVFLFFLLMG